MDFDASEILDELKISSDLEQEFIRQASYYAHWASMHVVAMDKVRLAEEQTELLFGRYYREYKVRDPAAKENDCKAYIRRKKNYQEASLRLRRALYEADMLKVAVKAFEMRKDMLVQLGAHNRSEYKSTEMALKKKVDKATRIVRQTVRRKIRKDS